MEKSKYDIKNIPAEAFEFVNREEKLSDTKFVDKPIGYLKDAWIRFCKNKGSIVAAIIIGIILLFAFLTPVLFTKYDQTFMDVYYAKKSPRNLWLKNTFGISDGSTTRDFQERGLILDLAIGIGAEDHEGKGDITLEQGMASYYQPILEIGEAREITGLIGAKDKTIYSCKLDSYLDVGFQYRSIEQDEFKKIVEWQEKTGYQVLYPLVEDNQWNIEPDNANY